MCVLGLCALMNMVGQRPQEVTDIAQQIMPSALVLFQGLKRAYASMFGFLLWTIMLLCVLNEKEKKLCYCIYGFIFCFVLLIAFSSHDVYVNTCMGLCVCWCVYM